MHISAATVKQLRDRTNAPMMDCKDALSEANGDMERPSRSCARRTRPSRPSAKARKRPRDASASSSIRPRRSAPSSRCAASAPVAKSEQFVALANDLAKQVALKDPATVEELLGAALGRQPEKTVNDRIGEVIGIIRENMKPARLVRLTGQLGSYVHHDGTVGVLLQVEGDTADPQLLRDICMHITAQNPLVGRRDEVPAERIEKEKEIAQAQIREDPKNASKPANIIEKIAEGKLKTWFAENVLVEQPFVKDDTKTIGALLSGAGLKLVKFARLQVGQVVS